MQPATVRPQIKLKRRGSGVMEAALVLPVLVYLTMGAMEFGYFFYLKHTLQGAAREGARAAITPGATTTDVSNAVNTAMNAAGFNIATRPGIYTVQVLNAAGSATVDPATATAGTSLQVRVNGSWTSLGVNPLGNLSPLRSRTTVVGQTVMRKEG
jgi:Flp pilus assembly protein TadG